MTISQCVFTYNEASDRGGVAALIGSFLYIDVNRTHIFNNTARLGGIISAYNSEVNVGAGELFMSADPVYFFCTLYNEDLIDYNVSTPTNPGNITPTNITSAELTLSADGNTITSSLFSSTALVIASSPLMSYSIQTTSKISSSAPAGVEDYDIPSIFPTSSVSFYRLSNTGGININTVHETLTGLSTVSHYSDIMSTASSNSIQNDNSAVPPSEYSSSLPVNILSSIIFTSSLAATSDLKTTENALFLTTHISVSSKIIPASQTSIKKYFSSSLDLNSMQNGLLTTEKSSLQVDLMETYTNKPLLSSSEPVPSSASEPIPSQLLSPTTSIKPSLSSQTQVSQVMAESNIVTTDSTSLKNELNTQLLSTTATTSSVSRLKITVIQSLPLSTPGSHFSSLSGSIASSTSLELEQITNGFSDFDDLKLNITMALGFVTFALLVVFVIFTGVLLVKKFSSKGTEKPSNVSMLYGEQVNPVYGFSMSKTIEAEMKEKDFYY